MGIRVLSLPTDKAIFNMLNTDTLQITFTQGMLFCSKDSDDFSPSLPDNVQFASGATWPDPQQYPNGASPAGDNDEKYKYKTQPNAKCDDPTATGGGGTIHVGSTVKPGHKPSH